MTTILSNYLSNKYKRNTEEKDLIRIYCNQLNEVISSNQISWKEKYDLIFDTHINILNRYYKECDLHLQFRDPDAKYILKRSGLKLRWCREDGSYEKEALYYMLALNKLVDDECRLIYDK